MSDATRYECCGCKEDVTAAVKAAFEDRRWGVGTILAPEDASSEGPVIVTCTKGHTCEYEPGGAA